MISQEQTVQKDPILSLSQEYTDKHISLVRASLFNNINSIDVISKKIKELENTMRVLKFDYEVLLAENKQIKQEIHDLKCSATTKQTFLEGY